MALGNFAAILKSNFSLFSEVVITTNVNSLIYAEMNDNGDKIIVSTNQGVQMYELSNSKYIPIGSIITSPNGYSPFIARINSIGDKIIVAAKTTNTIGAVFSKIRVYSFDGSNYTQLGNDFDQSYSNDTLASYNFCINYTGDTIFITHRHILVAKVFSWNGTTWNQKGSSLSAAGSLTTFGTNACINAAGDRVAMGIYNNGSCSVGIYNWNNATWNLTQIQPFNAFRFDNFGAMGMTMTNDGNTLAIGRLTSTTNYTMLVSIWNFDGTTWKSKGSSIERENTKEQIGRFSISPDGSTVIIQFSTQNYKIYTWDGLQWKKQRENMSYPLIQGTTVYASVDITFDGSSFLLPFDYYSLFKVIKT